MEGKKQDRIDFDILLRAPASNSQPHVSTINFFRPPPELIEKCRRWLAKKRITCHPTDFGLVCSAPRIVFESVFSIQLEPVESGPGVPRWRSSKDPQPPPEIANYIKQITISVEPEFF